MSNGLVGEFIYHVVYTRWYLNTCCLDISIDVMYWYFVYHAVFTVLTKVLPSDKYKTFWSYLFKTLCKHSHFAKYVWHVLSYFASTGQNETFSRRLSSEQKLFLTRLFSIQRLSHDFSWCSLPQNHFSCIIIFENGPGDDFQAFKLSCSQIRFDLISKHLILSWKISTYFPLAPSFSHNIWVFMQGWVIKVVDVEFFMLIEGKGSIFHPPIWISWTLNMQGGRWNRKSPPLPHWAWEILYTTLQILWTLWCSVLSRSPK